MRHNMISGFRRILHKYPIVRGMTSYVILYPTANAVQQLLDPQQKKFDPKESLRFCILGTFIVAPTIYCWVKVASVIIKGQRLKHSILKAVVEQFIYAPVAYTEFFVGISLLEGKGLQAGIEELTSKFWPTYKVGFCVWPLIQTANFWIIPERNRVPFISFCSFMWNIFLSYVHHRQQITKGTDI
ncbi:mpv17-like protein [Oratosquilla oratoria]|uniref:mpv17-like protein n=1 Tax=Oratosquilla oratoria TaxID=337810 RepID=UPI003F775695